MKRWAPLLPTVAVGIGMLVLRSGWTAIVLYHLGIALFLAAAPDRRRGLSLRGGSRWLGLAVPFAATGGLVLATGWPWFGGDAGSLARALAGLGLTGGAWTSFLIYYVLVNPWLEEIFWRGWLAPSTPRLHWHDFAFALYHALVLTFFLEPVWISLCFAVLVGAAWTWRWMVRAWGGLAGPIATHLAADVGIVAAAVWLLRRSG